MIKFFRLKKRFYVKVGSNSVCPCGSKQKYKKCCKVFHNGSSAKTALELMKSRYSAFVLSDYQYIIKTTHEENNEYRKDTNLWKDSILEFSTNCDFKNLEIIDFIKDEKESYVTFRATIIKEKQDISFTEKSKFLKVNNKWLYHSGEFIDE